MQRNHAEGIAIEALTWIAGSEDLLGVFMGATGTSVDDIRRRAGNPTLLASILDFVLMDDDWVRSFCDAMGHSYDVPGRARAALPGGQQTHWT